MANPEFPKPTSFLDSYLPRDLIAEFEKENFQEIAERLWDLDVVPLLYPHLPVAYSRPVDSERLAMIAFGEAVTDTEDENYRNVVQRIIFNTRSEDEETELPKITIDDYVVDYLSDTIAHQQSVVESRDTPEGIMYSFHQDMGPFINLDDMDLNVTFGKRYEDAYCQSYASAHNEAISGESLLEKLRLLSPAHRDTVIDLHFHYK